MHAKTVIIYLAVFNENVCGNVEVHVNINVYEGREGPQSIGLRNFNLGNVLNICLFLMLGSSRVAPVSP